MATLVLELLVYFEFPNKLFSNEIIFLMKPTYSWFHIKSTWGDIRSMETIYLSLVHTGNWGYLFHETPGMYNKYWMCTYYCLILHQLGITSIEKKCRVVENFVKERGGGGGYQIMSLSTPFTLNFVGNFFHI